MMFQFNCLSHVVRTLIFLACILLTLDGVSTLWAAGDADMEQVVQVQKARQEIVLLDHATGPAIIRAQIQLAAASETTPMQAELLLGSQDTQKHGAFTGRVYIMRSSKNQDGHWLRFFTKTFDAPTGKWQNVGDPRDLTFTPFVKSAVRDLEADGLEATLWHGRWIDLRIQIGQTEVTLWADGLLVANLPGPLLPGAAFPVTLTLGKGDMIRHITHEAWVEDPLFVNINLEHFFNDRSAQAPVYEKPAVPFVMPQDTSSFLSLRQAMWIDQKRDPQSFYETYDAGPPTTYDPRMTLISVPKADYVAIHLLAACSMDRQLTDTLTVRAGRYGYIRQVLRHDFVATIPRVESDATYQHVRLPLTQSFAQDVLDNIIDMEFTKEVHLARHVPDPNRFRHRPLGLPSGVRIAAITLEKSPLQMTVISPESANAFVQPQKPVFNVTLSNITDQEQSYVLEAQASQPDGEEMVIHRKGRIAAGQRFVEEIDLDVTQRGYYELSISLTGEKDQLLLVRRTSFALLPPDQRQYRDDSPFGTWEWNGLHVTSKDSDVIGSLFKKLGFRYGMSSHSPESRQKWGLLVSTEPKLEPELKQFDKMYEKDPTMPLRALIFHEDSISGPHVTRLPDLFHDRAPYKLNEAEEARYEKMLEQALGGAKAARKKYPGVHISIGNGPLPTKEEFYRRGFPADLFDSGGNEAGSFHRMPEAQPPDVIANNASIWMDRQLLDAYGYADKAVTQCFEVGYPNDNPGNHSSMTQADYFARNALHSLAWGMPFIHIGEITDVANSYYFSNWGAAGFCRAYPEMAVKPAFVTMATLTTVLDGARFVRMHDLGSPSLYAMQFLRGDGKSVLAMWTLRGRCKVNVTIQEESPWQLWNAQGQSIAAPGQVELTSSPIYLIGQGKIVSITAASPSYDDAPPVDAVVIDTLGDFSAWQVQEERDAELETYNPLEPRRKGNFQYDVVREFQGQGPAVRVVPGQLTTGKDTIPMYSILNRSQPIALPGQPKEIGLWINGNSGWGRVIYELEDAKGERWISLGAAAAEEAPPWLTDWMPVEMQGQITDQTRQISDWSTNDPYGVSRINFDGWRYVAFPLPGNYIGENHPWSVNSCWRWDGDGIVDYPLKLRKLVVELPEKVLHFKTWAAAPRQEIYLRNLTVGTTRP